MHVSFSLLAWQPCTLLTLLFLLNTLAYCVESRFNITVKYPPLKTTHFQPQVCVSLRVPQGKSYVTGMKPLGRVDKFHHMALFACLRPGHLEPTNATDHETQTVNSSPYWACMDEAIEGLPFAMPCYRKRRIFAWDKDPHEILFPEGYGFEVGKDSGNFYFVFTLHLVSAPLPDDNIQMEIYFREKVEHSFAVLDTYVNGFKLPPQSKSHVDCAIRIRHLDVTVFGFHPHTHGLGLMISGYKVTSGGQWDLIGKGKVLISQNMQPSMAGITLRKGDLVAFRCTYYNPHPYSVLEGRKFSEEMCMYNLWFVFNRPPTSSNLNLLYYRDCLRPDIFARAVNFTTFPEDANSLESP